MGDNLTLPCGLHKTVFSGEWVKPVVLTFTARHIFPQNWLFHWRFSSSILTNFISFLNFWKFLDANQLMTSVYTDDVGIFYFQPTLKFYWYCLVLAVDWLPTAEKLPSKSPAVLRVKINNFYEYVFERQCAEVH